MNMQSLRENAERKLGGYLPHIWSDIRVVDDSGNDVPPEGVGEILVRGPVVMRDYWQNPQATAEALQGGWLHTGDVARIDADGYIYPLDRKKNMVKTGGLNVYPVEVESVLQQLEPVREAAVIGLPHPKWIEAVTAVVVRKEGREITEGEIISYCRQHLADYKCPKAVIFVDELPRTASGKVLKRVLREEYSGLYGSAFA